MAFADPQSITVDSVAQSMPRISSGVGTGAFQSNDGTWKLSVSNQTGKRVRSLIRFDQTLWDTVAGISSPTGCSVYLVVDSPPRTSDATFTNDDLVKMAVGFLSYLSASSGAKVVQLIGQEN
jgi:hypothetical protein